MKKIIGALALSLSLFTVYSASARSLSMGAFASAPTVTAGPQDGSEAPDFTLENLEGKPFTLSSLRGKYVVLDFWGSWCYWCVKGIPQMKAYYQKYKDRMEILSVDCNESRTAWKAAVAKYEMPWLHVYLPDGGALLTKYGIQGFPTKVIISPEGKMIKTMVGEDPAFYVALDQLFAQ